MKTARPFFETKTLSQMSKAEWESLCDGCGQCCLHKIEDITTGDFHCTPIACKLLDLKTGRCRDYTNRKKQVPDCVQLTPKGAATFRWLPETCAYRVLAEGKPLPDWHPLRTGSFKTVQQAGMSIVGRSVSEADYPSPDDAITAWNESGSPALWIQSVQNS